MRSSRHRALGAESLPESIRVEGTTYRIERRFKHGFASALGLYGNGEDRVVCRFHRTASLLGVPMRWLGRRAAAHEAAVLKQVKGIPGVPRFRGMPTPTAVARDFMPGRPLSEDADVNEGFFPDLLELLENIHHRGIGYVDLEKAENILLGEDGRPYLADFQIAFYVRRQSLGETAPLRLLRSWFQRSDTYHALKHFLRMRPELLTPEQKAVLRRKPWPVRIGNLLMWPCKRLRDWILEQ